MKDLQNIMKQASKAHKKKSIKNGEKTVFPDDPLAVISSLGGKLPVMINFPKIVRKPVTQVPGKINENVPKLPKKAAKPKITCQGSSLYPYPGDCHKYIHCNNGSPNVRACPPGLVFNAKNNYCDWKYNVKNC